MTPAARLAAVIALYDDIIAAQKPSDQIMQNYFRQRKFIGSKDRKAVAAQLYQLFRHYARLHWWADMVRVPHDGRGLLLLWLVLHEGRDLQTLQQHFDGSGYAPAPLSSHEEKIALQLASQTLQTRDMPLDVAHECPAWAYDGLRQQFPQDFAAQMDALAVEAPLDLRVNTLMATRDAVLETLRRDGMDAAPTALSPHGIRVLGRPAFSAHPLYKNGQIEVQDEGSQLLALLCGVTPSEWVVDFCAGAGGKTMALAAMMQNKGRLWACDIDARRLENGRLRLRRAGVHCVETKALRDEADPWVKKHGNMADCVFIDAPCSGMGTWRRNPMARWQDLGPQLPTLLQLQQKIFASAARMVKSGGRLVYATCSMLPQENQDQVACFLEAHPEFTPLPLQILWYKGGHGDVPHDLVLDQHMLQLTPYQHGTDGFFVAALQRQ